MQRKGGGYRKPDLSARVLSLLSEASFKRFFQQIWTDIPGESTREHPAPYPVTLADRLIRMFSFVGDAVLDPFNGIATTQVAASRLRRSSIGIEVDPVYFADGLERLRRETSGLLSTADIVAGEGYRRKRAAHHRIGRTRDYRSGRRRRSVRHRRAQGRRASWGCGAVAEGGQQRVQVTGDRRAVGQHAAEGGGVDRGAQGPRRVGGYFVSVENLGWAVLGYEDIDPQVAPVEALRGQRHLVADVEVECARGAVRSGAIQAYRL